MTNYYQQPLPYVPAQPQNPEKNGFGLAAVILGPIGLLFCLMPITGFIGAILGFTGLIFALAGLSRVSKQRATNKKTAITGLAASLLAIVGGIAGIVMFFGAVEDLGDSFDCIDAANTAAEIDAC